MVSLHSVKGLSWGFTGQWAAAVVPASGGVGFSRQRRLCRPVAVVPERERERETTVLGYNGSGGFDPREPSIPACHSPGQCTMQNRRPQN